MSLIAVGLSHHTAPIEVREKLAISETSIPELLDRLRKDRLAREAVFLSTCNRVELYTVPEERTEPERIAAWLAETGGLRHRSTKQHFYGYQERDALRHLFRVASSLDSMILGEPQILGQVKQAYRLAVQNQGIGPVMHLVMERSLRAAKRVRTETAIGDQTVSVGRAGVELAAQVLGDLKGRSALLIGAGAHGKLVARAMLRHGLGELVIANRTFERAVDLARIFGGSAIHLDEIDRYLARVDLVLASTAAGKVIVSRSRVARVVLKRRFRPLVMIDLSVPRNIAPDVNTLEGIFRFDIDDLMNLADHGKQAREVAALEAERIVDEETERCWGLLQIENVNVRIGDMVRHAEQIRLQELRRADRQLGDLSTEERQAVEAMTRAMIKKILHQPIKQVRRLAVEGDSRALDRVLEMYGGGSGRGDDSD